MDNLLTTTTYHRIRCDEVNVFSMEMDIIIIIIIIGRPWTECWKQQLQLSSKEMEMDKYTIWNKEDIKII